jgi:hypothetical protein
MPLLSLVTPRQRWPKGLRSVSFNPLCELQYVYLWVPNVREETPCSKRKKDGDRIQLCWSWKEQMSIIPRLPPPPPASIGTFHLNPPPSIPPSPIPPPSIPPLTQDDGCGQKHVLQFPHYHCFSLLSFWLELKQKCFFFLSFSQKRQSSLIIVPFGK